MPWQGEISKKQKRIIVKIAVFIGYQESYIRQSRLITNNCIMLSTCFLSEKLRQGFGGRVDMQTIYWYCIYRPCANKEHRNRC